MYTLFQENRHLVYARSAKRVLAIVILSVCPSVCPCVRHVPVLIQAQAK